MRRFLHQHTIMIDGLTDTDRTQIQEILAQFPEITSAIIFGSTALGTSRPNSDIDICLYGKSLEDKHVKELHRILDYKEFPYIFDLIIHHEVKHPKLLKHLANNGISLYERAN